MEVSHSWRPSTRVITFVWILECSQRVYPFTGLSQLEPIPWTWTTLGTRQYTIEKSRHTVVSHVLNEYSWEQWSYFTVVLSKVTIFVKLFHTTYHICLLSVPNTVVNDSLSICESSFSPITLLVICLPSCYEFDFA